MKKSKIITQFVCQNCGNSSPRWLGKCPECGSWNTYVEEQQEKTKRGIKARAKSEPLPINKIQSGTHSSAKLQRAKQLVPSTKLALDLVGFDHEVENAMKYVFGRTLVCKDMDSAKKVTFDRAILS